VPLTVAPTVALAALVAETGARGRGAVISAQADCVVLSLPERACDAANAAEAGPAGDAAAAAAAVRAWLLAAGTDALAAVSAGGAPTEAQLHLLRAAVGSVTWTII
jgi:hypothetical protein